MTAMTLPHTRREPLFPTRTFVDYAVFALLAWLGTTLFAFIVTYAVSLFRPIEVSGWTMFGQVVRWFAFGTAIHFGWTHLQLHITHGGTRRGYVLQMFAFGWPYALLLALFYALSLVVEAGYYGLLNWPHVTRSGDEVLPALDFARGLYEQFLQVLVWFAAGLFVGVAWYRGSIWGGLSIVIGLAAVSLSSLSLFADVGPIEWIATIFPFPAGPVTALWVHAALYAVFMLLFWLLARNVPVRSKSQD